MPYFIIRSMHRPFSGHELYSWTRSVTIYGRNIYRYLFLVFQVWCNLCLHFERWAVRCVLKLLIVRFYICLPQFDEYIYFPLSSSSFSYFFYMMNLLQLFCNSFPVRIVDRFVPIDRSWFLSVNLNFKNSPSVGDKI